MWQAAVSPTAAALSTGAAPRRLQAILAAATPQALSNMAWACGQLGYKGKLLPAAVLHQAVKLLQGEHKGRSLMQNLCHLCWCAAVLDMQQHVSVVLQLAAATKQLWHDVALEHVQQLYQAHIWLLDIQLPAPGQGLSGILSQQQLQQCKAKCEQVSETRRGQKSSDLQRSVFAAIELLPQDLWQQQPAAEQLTADGLFSIDIAATTAAGVKVAIEVRGRTDPHTLCSQTTRLRVAVCSATGRWLLGGMLWSAFPTGSGMHCGGLDKSSSTCWPSCSQLCVQLAASSSPSSNHTLLQGVQPAPAARKRRAVSRSANRAMYRTLQASAKCLP